jgi:hypothetical protein
MWGKQNREQICNTFVTNGAQKNNSSTYGTLLTGLCIQIINRQTNDRVLCFTRDYCCTYVSLVVKM